MSEKHRCDVCGRFYARYYLYDHRRKAHGIYGGASGRPRQQSKAKPTTSLVAINEKAPNGDRSTFRLVEGFVLLQSNDGALWLAERIRV